MICDCFLHAAANLVLDHLRTFGLRGFRLWKGSVVSRSSLKSSIFPGQSSAFPCKDFDAFFNRHYVDQNPDAGIK